MGKKYKEIKEDENLNRNPQHMSYIIPNSDGFTTLMSGIHPLSAMFSFNEDIYTE